MSETAGLTELMSLFGGEERQAARASFIANQDKPGVQKLLKAIKKQNFTTFILDYIYPRHDVGQAMVESIFGENEEICFLFNHADFVCSHLTRLFETIEGPACSADKASTVMWALVSHFHTSKRIEFNYSNTNAYAFPKTVLTTQEDVLAFFEGLRELYSGNPTPYLDALLKARLAQRTP
jgi:hypothetical protein